MFVYRHLTAWLALAIAVAGPLPLWMHHALCHEHAGLECAGHDHSHVVSSSQAEIGNTGAKCRHHHADPSNDTGLSLAKSSASLAGDCEEKAFADRPWALYGVSPEHDCFVCYQLSQAVAPALFLTADFIDLPPVASWDAVELFSFTTLCGWHSPRGPPLA